MLGFFDHFQTLNKLARHSDMTPQEMYDTIYNGDLEDAIEAGNLTITIGDVREGGIAHAIDRALDHVAHCDALVIDCDIDVVDRSQFPAAPGARPGGMAVHDFFYAVRKLASDPRVRIIDLTEWAPPLDSTDLNALTAARWVAECLAGYEMR